LDLRWAFRPLCWLGWHSWWYYWFDAPVDVRYRNPLASIGPWPMDTTGEHYRGCYYCPTKQMRSPEGWITIDVGN